MNKLGKKLALLMASTMTLYVTTSSHSAQSFLDSLDLDNNFEADFSSEPSFVDEPDFSGDFSDDFLEPEFDELPFEPDSFEFEEEFLDDSDLVDDSFSTLENQDFDSTIPLSGPIFSIPATDYFDAITSIGTLRERAEGEVPESVTAHKIIYINQYSPGFIIPEATVNGQPVTMTVYSQNLIADYDNNTMIPDPYGYMSEDTYLVNNTIYCNSEINNTKYRIVYSLSNDGIDTYEYILDVIAIESTAILDIVDMLENSLWVIQSSDVISAGQLVTDNLATEVSRIASALDDEIKTKYIEQYPDPITDFTVNYEVIDPKFENNTLTFKIKVLEPDVNNSATRAPGAMKITKTITAKLVGTDNLPTWSTEKWYTNIPQYRTNDLPLPIITAYDTEDQQEIIAKLVSITLNGIEGEYLNIEQTAITGGFFELGKYELCYEAVDSSGNKITKDFIVNVIDSYDTEQGLEFIFVNTIPLESVYKMNVDDTVGWTIPVWGSDVALEADFILSQGFGLDTSTDILRRSITKNGVSYEDDTDINNPNLLTTLPLNEIGNYVITFTAKKLESGTENILEGPITQTFKFNVIDSPELTTLTTNLDTEIFNWTFTLEKLLSNKTLAQQETAIKTALSGKLKEYIATTVSNNPDNFTGSITELSWDDSSITFNVLFTDKENNLSVKCKDTANYDSLFSIYLVPDAAPPIITFDGAELSAYGDKKSFTIEQNSILTLDKIGVIEDSNFIISRKVYGSTDEGLTWSEIPDAYATGNNDDGIALVNNFDLIPTDIIAKIVILFTARENKSDGLSIGEFPDLSFNNPLDVYTPGIILNIKQELANLSVTINNNTVSENETIELGPDDPFDIAVNLDDQIAELGIDYTAIYSSNSDLTEVSITDWSHVNSIFQGTPDIYTITLTSNDEAKFTFKIDTKSYIPPQLYIEDEVLLNPDTGNLESTYAQNSTWSVPIVTQLKHEASERVPAIFGTDYTVTLSINGGTPVNVSNEASELSNLTNEIGKHVITYTTIPPTGETAMNSTILTVIVKPTFNIDLSENIPGVVENGFDINGDGVSDLIASSIIASLLGQTVQAKLGDTINLPVLKVGEVEAPRTIFKKNTMEKIDFETMKSTPGEYEIKYEVPPTSASRLMEANIEVDEFVFYITISNSDAQISIKHGDIVYNGSFVLLIDPGSSTLWGNGQSKLVPQIKEGTGTAESDPADIVSIVEKIDQSTNTPDSSWSGTIEHIANASGKYRITYTLGEDKLLATIFVTGEVETAELEIEQNNAGNQTISTSSDYIPPEISAKYGDQLLTSSDLTITANYKMVSGKDPLPNLATGDIEAFKSYLATNGAGIYSIQYNVAYLNQTVKTPTYFVIYEQEQLEIRPLSTKYYEIKTGNFNLPNVTTKQEVIDLSITYSITNASTEIQTGTLTYNSTYNFTTAGTYLIHFTASAPNWQDSEPVTMMVEVKENTSSGMPTLTLDNMEPIFINYGASQAEIDAKMPNVTALGSDGITPIDYTLTIKETGIVYSQARAASVNGAIDSSSPGIYTLLYTAVDGDKHAVPVITTMTVLKPEKPVFDDFTGEVKPAIVGKSYSVPIVTAGDAEVTYSINNSPYVNVSEPYTFSEPGRYILTYRAIKTVDADDYISTLQLAVDVYPNEAPRISVSHGGALYRGDFELFPVYGVASDTYVTALDASAKSGDREIEVTQEIYKIKDVFGNIITPELISDITAILDTPATYEVIWSAIDPLTKLEHSLTATISVIDNSLPEFVYDGQLVYFLTNQEHTISNISTDDGQEITPRIELADGSTLPKDTKVLDKTGTYKLIYTAWNASGTQSVELIITIIIENTTEAPYVTVTQGSNIYTENAEITIIAGTTIEEFSGQVSDGSNVVRTLNGESNSVLGNLAIGTHKLKFASVNDNSIFVEITINVVANTLPEFSVLADGTQIETEHTYNRKVGEALPFFLVSATDNGLDVAYKDIKCTISKDSSSTELSLDSITSQAGEYKIEYTVIDSTDSSQNSKFVINVSVTEPDMITIEVIDGDGKSYTNGSSISWINGASIPTLTGTASDSSDIIRTLDNELNTDLENLAVGHYILKFALKSNPDIFISINIEVEENILPIITATANGEKINSGYTLNLRVGDTLPTLKFSATDNGQPATAENITLSYSYADSSITDEVTPDNITDNVGEYQIRYNVKDSTTPSEISKFVINVYVTESDTVPGPTFANNQTTLSTTRSLMNDTLTFPTEDELKLLLEDSAEGNIIIEGLTSKLKISTETKFNSGKANVLTQTFTAKNEATNVSNALTNIVVGAVNRAEPTLTVFNLNASSINPQRPNFGSYPYVATDIIDGDITNNVVLSIIDPLGSTQATTVEEYKAFKTSQYGAYQFNYSITDSESYTTELMIVNLTMPTKSELETSTVSLTVGGKSIIFDGNKVVKGTSTAYVGTPYKPEIIYTEGSTLRNVILKHTKNIINRDDFEVISLDASLDNIAEITNAEGIYSIIYTASSDPTFLDATKFDLYYETVTVEATANKPIITVTEGTNNYTENQTLSFIHGQTFPSFTAESSDTVAEIITTLNGNTVENLDGLSSLPVGSHSLRFAQKGAESVFVELTLNIVENTKPVISVTLNGSLLNQDQRIQLQSGSVLPTVVKTVTDNGVNIESTNIVEKITNATDNSPVDKTLAEIINLPGQYKIEYSIADSTAPSNESLKGKFSFILEITEENVAPIISVA